MENSIFKTMEGSDKNPLEDEKLRAELYALSKSQPDKFTDAIYEAFERFPEFIILDTAPIEDKKAALGRMLKHYEDREVYERCIFLQAQLTKLDAIK